MHIDADISFIVKQTNDFDTKLMRTFFLAFAFLCISLVTHAQKPKNGTYTYSIAWAEWGGKSLGATCIVIINGDSIKVVHDGKPNVTGKKGDIYAEGLIMKHRKTGKWIIGRSEKDKDAKEIGGCSDGPSVIDFKRKMFWSC
jgi:hypothetical protein